MNDRRSSHHQLSWIFAGTGVVVAADSILWVLWVARWLLPLAAVAAGGWWWRRRHRRLHGGGRRVLRGQAVDEDDRLRAENDQLCAALREAQTAHDAAWDAAASVPPRHAPDGGSARDRLLTDRLAGVHDLFGRQS